MDLIRWSYQQTISPKKIKKQIVVGTYQYEELPNNMFKKTDACGGTNYWDILIKKAGLVGKKLKVVLMVDNRKS